MVFDWYHTEERDRESYVDVATGTVQENAHCTDTAPLFTGTTYYCTSGAVQYAVRPAYNTLAVGRHVPVQWGGGYQYGSVSRVSTGT